ncbi:hypothetical protein ACHAWF_011198 [Thalassiosira exigua]
MSTPASHTGAESKKSNALLTPSERESKRRLKSELKLRRKVKRLETRIEHAISRKDPAVEESAREELRRLLRENGLESRRPCTTQQDDAFGPAAMEEVLAIFRRLLSSIDDGEREKLRSDKIQQTEKARHLLRNMTKGTQTKSMFLDPTALRGYVRQKFHGRAALVVESLGRLSPNAVETAAASLHNHLDNRQQQQHAQQRKTMSMCWETLSNIKKICSLGCGPGNDAVGLTCFLRSYFDSYCVEEVYMLDYAIEEWKDATLDALIPILAPEYANRVTCISCDVTKPLCSDTIEQMVKESDIFLTSYLLTETRSQWDEFFAQLISLAKVGALFYFSEPVPWQLHRLIRMSSESRIESSQMNRLRFVWIDSSMQFPDMQSLDGRSEGPAILLAVKT